MHIVVDKITEKCYYCVIVHFFYFVRAILRNLQNVLSLST